jgi:NAD(P)-dependent dehydrogenase (short-subunit alcohol dehydrogenase family)
MTDNNRNPEPSIHPKPPIHPSKLITMARYLARKAVKDGLRANGLRPEYVEPATISRAAGAYLRVSKEELIEQAKAILTQS